MASTTAPTVTNGTVSGELRLAVSMNGGVSLAIWMGGVTAELLELVRSTEPDRPDPAGDGYRSLMGLVEQTVRLDVVAGASAGGINGLLLGIALANDVRNLDVARRIWLEQGDLGRLLRSPALRDVPSMLDGEVFRQALRDALGQVASGGGTPGYEIDHDLSVELSLTVLDGIRSASPDATNTVILDTDYEATVTFTAADLADENNADAWATAARASASFPVAFEPVAIDVSPDGDSLLRDRLRPAPPPGSTTLWIVDGGTLNNKPIDRVLDRVFAQPASGPVRRLALQVVPDPGSTSGSKPTDHGEYTLPEVLFSSLVTMPRNESIRNDIERIETNNRRAAAFSNFRWEVASRMPGSASSDEAMNALVNVATPLLSAFMNNASTQSGQRTWQRTRRVLSERNIEFPAVDDNTVIAELARERRRHYPAVYFAETSLVRHGEPVSDGGSEYWGYGLTSSRRIAAAVIDLIQGVVDLVPANQADLIEPITALFELLSQVHDNLREMLDINTDRTWIESHMAALPAADDVEAWAQEFYTGWVGFDARTNTTIDKKTAFLKVGMAAVDCGRLLREAAPHIAALSDWAGENDWSPTTRQQLIELAGATKALTWWSPEPHRADGFSGADWTVRQLLAIEMLYSMSASETMVPQQLELVQVSGFARDLIGTYTNNTTRLTPAQKMTGSRAGHFGAFYLRSWRANDWMWGRLDAADRLTTSAFSRAQLQRCWFGEHPEHLIKALRRAATSTQGRHGRLEADLGSLWDSRMGTRNHNIVGRVAKSLVGRETPDQDDGFATVVELLALRRQLEIAILELPIVANELRRDLADEGTPGSGAQQAFLRSADSLGAADDQGPGLQAIGDTLAACEIGMETIGGDASSDRFARLSGHAAATASNVVQTAVPSKSVRRATSSVRGVGLGIFAIATLASQRRAQRSQIAALILTTLFAISGAFYAAAFVVARGGPLLSLLAVSGLVIIALVSVREKPLVVLVLALAVALLLPALVWNIDDLSWVPDQAVEAIQPRRSTFAVITAIVAFSLLGLLSVSRIDASVTPRKKEPQT